MLLLLDIIIYILYTGGGALIYYRGIFRWRIRVTSATDTGKPSAKVQFGVSYSFSS
jgi:hypothetical protein